MKQNNFKYELKFIHTLANIKVMKKSFLTFLIIFITLEIDAQTIINPVWIKTEFGSVNNLSEAWGVDVDDSGQCLLGI